MKRLAVVGFAAKDLHYKVENFSDLPDVFRKHRGLSVRFSEIGEVFGKGWDINRVLASIEPLAVRFPTEGFSYAGRAFIVACQMARLGANVTLVGEVGDDFTKAYKGFFNGSYKAHLEKLGVSFSVLEIRVPKDLWERHYSLERFIRNIPKTESTSIIEVCGREIPTVLVVKDVHGQDIFFLDDVNSASKLTRWRPVPKELLKKVDAVFITSGDADFNLRIAKVCRKLGKNVFLDVGLFGATASYFTQIVPKVDILFGNIREIQQVMLAFGCSSIEELFLKTKKWGKPTIIVEEDKIKGKIKLFERESGKQIIIGPIDLNKKGSSTGVCDCMAAGFLTFFQEGKSLEECCKAGLITGSAIWEIEGVQEGLIDKQELELRWQRHFG